jgi:hypothetical protein
VKPTGLEKLAEGSAFGEFGTKESGFAGGGPFSCMNCAHRRSVKDQAVCGHPKVNDDPELKKRNRSGGFVIIGFDDCCRYVRPADED